MPAPDIVGRVGPLAPTALACTLGFTTGGVTSVLDRLEQAGHIRRRPHPGDRRRQVVQVTDAATARDKEVFGELIDKDIALLASHPDGELLVIDDFLQRISRLTAPTPFRPARCIQALIMLLILRRASGTAVS